MAVKIVTDSLSDLTEEITRELDITVVPVYVRFGKEVYRDRIEITTEEFYRRLVQSETLPTTTQPSPHDFLTVYQRLARETDEILVINLSSKLSGTYESASQARKMLESKTRVEVIDTHQVIMGLGLIVIEAARRARQGATLAELMEFVRWAMGRTHSIMALDTLKYLAKGGRIGKAQGLLGSMLMIKPVLTLREGVVCPLTRVRSRQAGLDYLYQFAAGHKKIDWLAVEHATTPEDAAKLADRLGEVYPREKIIIATVSPVIGTYVGPHVISITVVGD